MLEPDLLFLNHGSFGSCPRPVLEAQARRREQMERQPVEFFVRRLGAAYDEARAVVARFLGGEADNLAWVPNATSGINAILRSMDLRPGDELLTTDHEYNACRNVLEFAAARADARVVVAEVPFPLSGPEQAVEAIVERVTSRTRLLLVDHVTSQSALVMPIEALVRELRDRDVEILIDGAHAPGMVPIDLGALDVEYYVGNCHKWLCAPKGAGFLHVRDDRQASVRPAIISHGANSTRTDRSRYLIEFDWMGTADPTAVLCVPDALHFMESLLPGGWPELYSRNRDLALAGRRVLCAALDVPPPCPDEMIGAMASLPLPPGERQLPNSALYADPLQDVLLEKWRIEVPIIPWPASPRRMIRISAQVYNRIEQYERLAEALAKVLASNA